MTFAHPWMLLGMAAAFIPLLVHLFDRRRPKVVPFAALAFVLRSQRRNASRLKLRRIVLYALRTLIFLAIPIALAQPQRRTVAVSDADVAATAVAIDTSFIMRFAADTPLFEKAKDEAKSAIRALRPEESAVVVVCASPPRAIAPLGFDRVRLLSSIDALKPGYQAYDLNQCLEVAARALDESPLPGRRLVLVSAMARASLDLARAPPSAAGPTGEAIVPHVLLRDVARRGAIPNRAIVDGKVELDSSLGSRGFRASFTVRSFATPPASDLEMTLSMNGEVIGKGFVDVAGDTTAQKIFTHRAVASGPATLVASLTADALRDDDTRTLTVDVPRDAVALVVDGSPSPQKYKDEAYFLEAALNAQGSPVRSVVRDADAAWAENFNTYDAIFLLNVAAPDARAVAALKEFVASGGGLFVSMGDHVDPEAWNQAASALLPRKLRVVKTSANAAIRNISTTHPILAPFVGTAREGLNAARFGNYVLFETDTTAGHGGDVLAELDDGAPLMLAGRNGRGRVVVLATSVNREWSDLPLRTAFLPVVQRVAGWLVGTIDERPAQTTVVGDTVSFEPEVNATSLRAPSGATLEPAGTQPTRFGPLQEPGKYDVLDAQGAVIPLRAFAVGIASAASDPTRPTNDALDAWVGNSPAPGLMTERSNSQPIWAWLLLAAVAAFFAEGILIRK